MAEHKSGPVEVGAAMDYAEHEKTYKGFINAAKYVSMLIAVGFFSSAGFLFSTLLFIVLSLLGFFVL
jgi:hypothetical protein